MLEPLAILSYLMARPFGNPDTAPSMRLTLTHVPIHTPLPKRHTCRSTHPSPPTLRWSQAPDGTQSFALILMDLDAPRPAWYHWAIYNLPDTATRYDQHTRAQTAMNSFGSERYDAPCAKHRPHHYRLELYALNTTLPTDTRYTAYQLRKAVQPYLLATTHRDFTVKP